MKSVPLKGELYGIRREDSGTVSVAFAGEILNVSDKSIKWQVWELLPSDDDDLKNILANYGVQVVCPDKTALSPEITLHGKMESIKQTLRVIGYNL